MELNHRSVQLIVDLNLLPQNILTLPAVCPSADKLSLYCLKNLLALMGGKIRVRLDQTKASCFIGVSDLPFAHANTHLKITLHALEIIIQMSFRATDIAFQRQRVLSKNIRYPVWAALRRC